MKIIKVNKKNENFYNYMGGFFGSRALERETNDRIYDDDNKDWYVAIDKEEPVGFVSVANNRIKNVYGTKETYVEKLLNRVAKDGEVLPSTVTKLYEEVYKKCSFSVSEDTGYKNFVIISK